MTQERRAGCPLCEGDGGRVVVATPRWRLVHAVEEDFPAFYRVVWDAHVAEFSDLSAADRAECMDVVVAVEQALRRHLAPTKVNVASLGNAVPHLHWHVIARYDWDSHFPAPVWAAGQRSAPQEQLVRVTGLLPALEGELAGLDQAPGLLCPTDPPGPPRPRG